MRGEHPAPGGGRALLLDVRLPVAAARPGGPQPLAGRQRRRGMPHRRPDRGGHRRLLHLRRRRGTATSTTRSPARPSCLSPPRTPTGSRCSCCAPCCRTTALRRRCSGCPAARLPLRPPPTSWAPTTREPRCARCPRWRRTPRRARRSEVIGGAQALRMPSSGRAEAGDFSARLNASTPSSSAPLRSSLRSRK